MASCAGAFGGPTHGAAVITLFSVLATFVPLGWWKAAEAALDKPRLAAPLPNGVEQ